MNKYWILFVLLLDFLAVSGQYFNGGQDRASLQWKKIISQNFDVIYPEGFDQQAEKIIRMLEMSYLVVGKTLDHQPKHISVILHTETVKSNAFLGWAPSRIEMYTTPHQGIYAQDWLEQLAIHEYRHMVQISKLESEMPRLLRILFGEQAAAMLTAMYLPFWFIEGDAVVAETGLSTSGRGRQPDFHRELKAQILDKGIYSYDKAYLGSYKDHVANHYQLGYFMVGTARTLYHQSIWNDVLEHVAHRPFSLNAFNRGLKKTVGLTKVALYDTVFKTLHATWNTEDQTHKPTAFQTLSPEHKIHTNYRYIHPLSDTTFFAERTTENDINRFVIIHQDGNEEVVFTPGYHFEESVSVNNHKVIWIERLPHFRWFHADRSLLRIYDLKQKKLQEFPMDTKIFAPSLSPDMKRLVLVEADAFYKFYLSIVDVQTGSILKRINLPGNDYLITPAWMSNNIDVLVVSLRNNQKGILKINTETEQDEVLFPFGSYELNKPLEINNEVYFIGGFEGTDHIYRINREGKIEKIIQSRFGIADHAYRKRTVYYSNYTANGFQLVSSCLDSLSFDAIDLASVVNTQPIADILSKQEGGPVVFKQESGSFAVSDYRKWQHLFNIHSWAPLAIQPYSYSIHPGLSFLSQNMLSTSEFAAGYRYRWQDEQGEFYFNYSYLGCLPLFEMEASTGGMDSYYFEVRQILNTQNQVLRVDTLKHDFKWQESNFLLRASLPINLSKGKYNRRLQPRLKYQFSNIAADERAHATFPAGNYQNLEAGLYFHHLLTAAGRDVQPDFGVMIDLSYSQSLGGVLDFGKLFAVSNVVYLPGFSKSHGFTLYNGFQKKSANEYGFSDRIRFPRGHQHVVNQQMYSTGIDYAFPVCYPDKQFWGLIYLKRLRMKVFYDQAWYKGNSHVTRQTYNYQGNLKSTGVEFEFDTHLFRFIAPVELGFRTSYLFNNQFKIDFLFNITFSL